MKRLFEMRQRYTKQSPLYKKIVQFTYRILPQHDPCVSKAILCVQDQTSHKGLSRHEDDLAHHSRPREPEEFNRLKQLHRQPFQQHTTL